MKTSKELLREKLKQAELIVIVGHFNPDGDAVGSSMGLKKYLENIDKKATVIFPNAYAKNLAWMDEKGEILNFIADRAKCNEIIAKADLLFCMDFNQMSRTNEMEQALLSTKAYKVLIDHHISPITEQFDICYSQVAVSSTCELLYKLFTTNLYAEYIDKKVGECLYAGVSTDTGSFSFSCAHKDVYLMVADLVERGVEVVEIHKKIFDTFTESRMRLMGHCLSKKLVVLPQYCAAYISITKDELYAFKYQAGDTEGLVNNALSIENIKIAAFFSEREDRVRISFRSKGDVDVNVFAKEHFNGGGHKNAAGGSSYVSLEATLEKFESLLPEFYAKNIK